MKQFVTQQELLIIFSFCGYDLTRWLYTILVSALLKSTMKQLSDLQGPPTNFWKVNNLVEARKYIYEYLRIFGFIATYKQLFSFCLARRFLVQKECVINFCKHGYLVEARKFVYEYLQLFLFDELVSDYFSVSFA